MKTNRLMIAASVACLFFVLSPGCKNKPKTEAATMPAMTMPAAMSHEDSVKRGSYLVATIGCGDCHTPKTMTPQGPQYIQALTLSGYRSNVPLPKVEKNAMKLGWVLFTGDLNASVGPWGISYAANLTPDQTGIGNWPVEDFMRAMKQGKFKGMEAGRDLLPPMPWQNFANLTDEDVKAIFVYLKTIPPVNNVVPAAVAPPDIK
jgi:hypothetical protein